MIRKILQLSVCSLMIFSSSNALFPEQYMKYVSRFSPTNMCL